MYRLFFTLSLFLFSLTCYSQTGSEQGAVTFGTTLSDTDLPDVFYTATPVLRSPPNYPKEELARRNEGWVFMSFVITAEGKVVDPIVLDSSGSKSFEQAALASVQKYVFSPARLNGKNVEQCSNEYKLTFQLTDNKGVPRKFAHNFRQFVKYLEDNNIDKAKEYLAVMESMPDKNLYQSSWLWWAKYLFANKTNNDEEKINSLSKAIAYVDQFLPDEIYARALAELFVLSMSRLQVTQAMNALDKLKNAKDSGPYLENLSDYIAKVETALNSGQPLLVKAEMKSGKAWKHSLYRKNFRVDKISGPGTLEKYELRCRNIRISDNVVAGEKITIPDNSGDCIILLHGDGDADFEFYEI